MIPSDDVTISSLTDRQIRNLSALARLRWRLGRNQEEPRTLEEFSFREDADRERERGGECAVACLPYFTGFLLDFFPLFCVSESSAGRPSMMARPLDVLRRVWPQSSPVVSDP